MRNTAQRAITTALEPSDREIRNGFLVMVDSEGRMKFVTTREYRTFKYPQVMFGLTSHEHERVLQRADAIDAHRSAQK